MGVVATPINIFNNTIILYFIIIYNIDQVTGGGEIDEKLISSHLLTVALNWSMTLLGSLLDTIALPDTIILAPA